MLALPNYQGRGRRAIFSLAVAAIFSVATIVPAQITYLSEDYGVEASVSFDTNHVPPGQFTYSGDYSASAGSSSPLSSFDTNLIGSATVLYANSSSLSAAVGAWQNTLLTAREISYSSAVSESANGWPSSWNESSFLEAIFVVTSPVAYSLTCQRGPDPLFSTETWTLSSANQGVLITTPSGGGSDYSGPFSYSGFFLPGDQYTLALQETGGLTPPPGGDHGLFQVVLAVPEPASPWLVVAGISQIFFLRQVLKRSGLKSSRRSYADGLPNLTK